MLTVRVSYCGFRQHTGIFTDSIVGTIRPTLKITCQLLVFQKITSQFPVSEGIKKESQIGSATNIVNKKFASLISDGNSSAANPSSVHMFDNLCMFLCVYDACLFSMCVPVIILLVYVGTQSATCISLSHYYFILMPYMSVGENAVFILFHGETLSLYVNRYMFAVYRITTTLKPLCQHYEYVTWWFRFSKYPGKMM